MTVMLNLPPVALQQATLQLASTSANGKRNRTMSRTHDKQLNVPGRFYGFTVTFLAVLIAGVSFDAFSTWNPPSVAAVGTHTAKTSTNADPESSDLITHSVAATAGPSKPGTAQRRTSLGTLCLTALVIGVLSLLVPRPKPHVDGEDTASRIERLTGLPVLASLFPIARTERPRQTRMSGLLATLIASCELVLILAFFATLAACMLRPTLVQNLRNHPLDGYHACVHELSDRAHGLWQTAPNDLADTASPS